MGLGMLRAGARLRGRLALLAVAALVAVTPPAVDALRAVPAPAAPLTSGMVSITFDDGWLSQWTLARPQMRTRGLVGTYFLTTESIRTGSSCCLTQANVRALITDGNEIGAHTLTHRDLTTLDPVTLDRELTEPKAWLASTFGVTARAFASPYGSTNPAVMARIKQVYSSHRTVSSALADSTTYVDALPSYDIHTGVSVASVRALIDRAMSERRWAILTFHELVSAGASTGTQYNIADFNAILDYLRQRRVPVVTISQGVARLDGATTPVIAGQTALYDNQLVNGFTDWSWATRQMDQSRLVRSAPNAIEVNLSSWGGLQFHTPGVSVSANDSLELWLTVDRPAGRPSVSRCRAAPP